MLKKIGFYFEKRVYAFSRINSSGFAYGPSEKITFETSMGIKIKTFLFSVCSMLRDFVFEGN